MKRFRFSLQALLTHRENIEEQKKRELGEARQLLASLEDEVRTLREEFHQTRVDFGGANVHNGAQGLQLSYFLNAVKSQIIAKMEAVEKQRHNVELKYEELVEASKERKALEILRDKRKEEARKEAHRKETAQLDELGLQRAVRNQKEVSL